MSTKICRSEIIAALTACAAFAPLLCAASTITKPDALLSVDMNRVAVVDRIVDQWKGELDGLPRATFRAKLMGLRADQLLAVNMSGNFDAVLLSINSNGRSFNSETETVAYSSDRIATQDTNQLKAVGEANRDLVYTPVTPCRFLDTRQTAAGNPIAAGTTRDFDVTNASSFVAQGGSATSCNIDAGAAAIAINYVATQQTRTGWIALYPAGTPRPTVSSLNFPEFATQSAESRVC